MGNGAIIALASVGATFNAMILKCIFRKFEGHLRQICLKCLVMLLRAGNPFRGHDFVHATALG
jgi:hypothetical protein